MAEMAARIGLDYFTIDCAENKRGELLIFEADNTAVVHNMDSPELFPYKPPQMRAIFETSHQYQGLLDETGRVLVHPFDAIRTWPSSIAKRSTNCTSRVPTPRCGRRP